MQTKGKCENEKQEQIYFFLTLKASLKSVHFLPLGQKQSPSEKSNKLN